MARGLDDIIVAMYSGRNYQHCYRPWREEGTLVSNTAVMYIEIPIKEDVFEVPIFALDAFVKAVGQNRDIGTEAIVAALNTLDRTSDYKSVERCMKDILVEDFLNSRLVKINVKDGEDTVLYYGTQGAVFKADFTPIMVASWQFERYIETIISSGEGEIAEVKYKFLKGILRVDPGVYVNKADPMEKFIVNKIINTCLTNIIRTPPAGHLGTHFSVTAAVPFQVEIGYNPFIIHDADTPSISTTNEQLLQAVLDHTEEVMQ